MLTNDNFTSQYEGQHLTELVQKNDSLYYRSKLELKENSPFLVKHLEHWSQVSPDRPFLAERATDGSWTVLTYREAKLWVDSVGAMLLSHMPPLGARILIISENSILHGVVALAAMLIGVAVVPIAPNQVSTTRGMSRVNAIVEITHPYFVYLSAAALASSIQPILSPGCTHVTPDKIQSCKGARAKELPLTEASILQKRSAMVVGDAIAKIMFTSGTTGSPKGVVNTHRMLAAQQEQMAALWLFLKEHPPVLCDWLPWNHTSGGNNSFNMSLANGGTLYIDDGRPSLEAIEKTARNLIDVCPTWYTNVPLGYSALLPLLQKDTLLCEKFFSRLDLLVYGGAGISAQLWTAIDRLAKSVTGRSAPWASGWGLTETTSTTTITHFRVSGAGQIGTPLPGMDCRLRKHENAFSISVKGPNVTPGYFSDQTATSKAFDDEGFFITGDLVSFVDNSQPDRGLRFEGRLSEQFKLASGTWVAPSRIKQDLLAKTGPLVRDIIVEGVNRPWLIALLWINDEIANRDFGWKKELPAENANSKKLREFLSGVLSAYNSKCIGGSERIERAYILEEPPSVSAGDLTDKGTIYLGRFRALRQSFLDSLYESPADMIGATSKWI